MVDYSSLGAKEVSGDHPAGNDVRFEDIFEKLQQEIDKLSSPADFERFSWQAVVDTSAEIIENFSKDILVAGYLSVGLIHTKGCEGLMQGEILMYELMEKYWDDLYPPVRRMKGRELAIQWWIEKTKAAVDEMEFKHADTENLQIIQEYFNKINKFVTEKTEKIDGIAGLEKKISKIIIGLGEKEETKNNGIFTKAMEIEEKSKRDEPETYSPPKSENVGNADEAEKYIKGISLNIKRAAATYRKERPFDFRSYRWLRFSVWGTINELPVAVDGVKTKLAPPAGNGISKLNSLYNSENWEALLEESESKLFDPAYALFLDINRFTAESLLNLGAKFKSAYDIVCGETIMLIKRLKGIEKLAYKDGTPFASEETIAWIESLNSEQNNNEYQNFSSSESADLSQINEKINQAVALTLNKETISQGIISLQELIQNSPSRKDAMLVRLSLIKVLIKQKKEAVAMAHLEKIYSDITSYKIYEWEPETALQGLKTVYSVYKKKEGKRYKEKSEEVLNLMANISVIEAMNL